MVTVIIETIALIQLSYTVAYDDHFDCDDGGDDEDYDDDAVQLSQHPVYSLLPYANWQANLLSRASVQSSAWDRFPIVCCKVHYRWVE